MFDLVVKSTDTGQGLNSLKRGLKLAIEELSREPTVETLGSNQALLSSRDLPITVIGICTN